TGLLLAAGTSAAADSNTNYVPVYVNAECEDDSVGERLAYKVREAIRRSASMKVAVSYSDSVIQSSIVCLNPNSDDRGVISRYSHAITFINTKGTYDYELIHGVGTCGVNKIDSCAESIAASIDKAIVDLKEQIANGKFKPFDP